MKNMGFGMMRLPLKDENDLSSVDQEEVNKMVDLFMDKGFTYFDTAYPYHEGMSEVALREAVVKRYPRDSFVIADKMPTFAITEYDQVESIFKEQLERCGVDYFDYYMMHNVSSFSESGWLDVDSFGFVKEMKDKGKIKNLGLSTHANAEFLDNILSKHPEMEFVQLQINYLDWENEGVEARKCVEVAHKYDLPIIVMEPLKGGFLANVPESAEKLIMECNSNQSPISLALRYVAEIDGVFMVLSGASNLEQLKENISIMEECSPLSEDEHIIIEKVTSMINSQITVPCTNCNYCVDVCPMNINIPKLFSFYNNEKIEGLDGMFTAVGNAYVNYSKLDGVGIASDCTGCGACMELCPQHINIVKNMVDVSKTFETEIYGFKQD